VRVKLAVNVTLWSR